VRVRFFFFMKTATGVDEVEIPADLAPDIETLVEVLVSRFGLPLKNELLTGSGELRRDINILVNGRNIEFISGVKTKLNDGDTVSFLSAVAGG
jgi:molybdopterin synthase sulfur carrier subunit